MHMVSGTVIFDPYAIGSLNTSVGGCFAAVRESAEYCIVRRNVGIVGIGQIGCSWIIATALATLTTSSPAAAAASCFLVLASLHCIVLFGNTLVAILFNVISTSAVTAIREVLPWW